MDRSREELEQANGRLVAEVAALEAHLQRALSRVHWLETRAPESRAEALHRALTCLLEYPLARAVRSSELRAAYRAAYPEGGEEEFQRAMARHHEFRSAECPACGRGPDRKQGSEP